MKNKTKATVSALLCITVLALPGCGKSADKTTTDQSASTSSESMDLVITNSTYNDNVTGTGTGTTDAEGYIPTDIPEGTIIETEIGKEFTFTENGADAYAVTIEKAEFTDRRSILSDDDAEKVLLVTYSYRSLNGSPCLVDSMSFRLISGETSMESYNIADQICGELATDSPVTAEVCYSVPSDADTFSLYVVDSAAEDNENYLIPLDLS